MPFTGSSIQPTVDLTAVGTPNFFDAEVLSTPGIEQTLITQVVGAGITRRLSSVYVTFRSNGCWSLEVDGNKVASGRTGPARPFNLFKFDPERDVSTGSTIELKFTAGTATKASDVEAYLQVRDI